MEVSLLPTAASETAAQRPCSPQSLDQGAAIHLPERICILEHSIGNLLLSRLINISYTHIISRKHLSSIYLTSPYAHACPYGTAKIDQTSAVLEV